MFVMYYTHLTRLRYEGWAKQRDQELVRRREADVNLQVEEKQE